MKFVALISGGKDSIYATLQAIENGHELVCCAHLAPLSSSRRNNISKDDTDDESYMYQTAGSEAVQKQVEECIGVPFYIREIQGRSKNISLIYDNNAIVSRDDTNSNTDTDEVEDLYLLLKQIQIDHPEIAGVSSGAILSTYQRTRIENVCYRLNLISLSFLWRMSCQRTLLDSILDDGEIHAILVRVACPPGLIPQKHLGKSLRELRDNGIIDDIQHKYQIHPAGEGGEYETLVLDCPKLFKYGRLVLDETEVITDTCDESVGNLRIIKCSVIKKSVAVVTDNNTHHVLPKIIEGIDRLHNQVTQQIQMVKSNIFNDTCVTQLPTRALSFEINQQIHQSMNLPNVRIMKGGLCHITAILAPIASSNQLNDEALAAVQEFLSIRQILSNILTKLFPNDKPSSSAQDIIFVHLYLSEMSHFARINQYYQEYFGTQLPPSRACVGIGKNALPGGRRVMMDCIFQRGSGAYLRQGDITTTTDCDNDNHENTSFLVQSQQNKHHYLRKTLHVQSISTWAPVCIGPYSQANVIRSSLVFLAGMIGLVPQSMTLIKPTCANVIDWEVQLYQSWRNAAAVLDGLEGSGGKLEDCLGGLVYLSVGALRNSLLCSDGEPNEVGTIPWARLWKTAKSICCDAICTNAGVVMGSVDGAATPSPYTLLDPSLYDDDGVLYGGYEDEDTWREMIDSTTTPSTSPPTSVNLPLLMVCLPELPANAEAEVELILASRRAASCLNVSNSPMTHSRVQCATSSALPSHFNGGIMWDTGYEHTNSSLLNDEKEQSCVVISSISRFVGLGCACVSTVIARFIPNNDSLIETANAYDFDVEEILSRMIDFSFQHAKEKEELSSLFNTEDVLNVRLYFIAASVSQRVDNDDASIIHLSSIEIEYVDDGSTLRTQLHSVLQRKSTVNIPAYTIVPVLGMHLDDNSDGVPILAMQVTMADMTRMETEMWIRHNRQYNYDN